MKTREEIKERMNVLESGRTPFFLLLDFVGEQGDILTEEDMEKEDIYVSFPFKQWQSQEQDFVLPALDKFPQSILDYTISFDQVMQHIRYGNSFLTNLTCSTPIQLNQSLDQLFQKVRAKYKVKFKQDWLSFSPETFIQIENGVIRTFPMKGTIDAAIPNAEEKILKDEKETAEHYTIVDLIRNDLSIVAENIRVKRFRYIDRIKTNSKELLQVSSEIEGDLLPGKRLSDIIFQLLPAGSISGAPKKKTVDIIREAETHERGFYTGTAYYFDGESVDSCVLIRFIENTGSGYVYKSGGGITIRSEMDKEYEEMVDKVYLPGSFY